jgi:hypothetical protein
MVTVRRREAAGPVSEVGYVLAEAFPSHDAAIKAAERYAVLASLDPERLIRSAGLEFALQ